MRARKCEHPHALAGSLGHGHYCPLALILWHLALVTDNDVHYKGNSREKLHFVPLLVKSVRWRSVFAVSML